MNVDETSDDGLLEIDGSVHAGSGSIVRQAVAYAPLPLWCSIALARCARCGVALSSHLAERRVSARMATAARAALTAVGLDARIEERRNATALQPGAALAVFADLDGGVRLGADRAGAPHRRAERIGSRVAHQLLDEIRSHATLDRFASDQILPFTALAAGESTFRVPFVTEYLETGGWLASLFLGAEVRVRRRTVVIASRWDATRAAIGKAGSGGSG